MSAFLSDDDGKTWRGGLLLDERSSVSYPDGFQAPDGLIHILYDWNRHTDAEILLAKFREEDVLAGKLVSRDAKLLMLANKATGPKPILYNGIELPYEWPPRHLDPASTEPMPVPYLRRPPKTIPIDVGRQLFVDDFLIENTDLKRTFHKAKKFEGNPVFKAETPRELADSTLGERGQQATVFLGQGGVFWDPAEKHFKMFYVAGWRGPLSLATSTDMKHWTRQGPLLPEGLSLDRAETRKAAAPTTACGSTSTPRIPPSASSSSPAGCTCRKSSARRASTTRCTSATDARGPRPCRPTWRRMITARSSSIPSARNGVFSIKRGTARGRSRYYHESDDFLKGADWSKAVYWTNADRLDAPEPEGRYPGAGDPPQLYSLNAVAYESLMVGMHYIHRGPKNEVCDKGGFPKLIDLELGFSRDGFHWDRPDRSGFIVGSRTEGAWDRAYLHSTAGVFVVLDDQLVFPYTGTSGIAPSGKRGMYTGARHRPRHAAPRRFRLAGCRREDRHADDAPAQVPGRAPVRQPRRAARRVAGGSADAGRQALRAVHGGELRPAVAATAPASA